MPHQLKQRTQAQAFEEERAALLAAISKQQSLFHLLNDIDNTAIFFKNLAGEMVYGNQHLLNSLGVDKHRIDRAAESGDPPLCDRDLFPSHLVEKYRRDDQEVIASGKAKKSIVEPFKNKQGLLQWFITHKYPIFDQHQRVIGVMGVLQAYQKTHSAAYDGDKALLATTLYIQQHFKESISTQKLCQLSQLPPRQYQRKFKRIFGVSPQEYIIRQRIYFACKALRNSQTDIANIGINAGFYDQSSFTRQFKKYMHTTPLQYRKALRAACPQPPVQPLPKGSLC